MLSTLGSCLIVIATIHTIIIVHEWGHYIVARWLQLRIQTFTIGLGTLLYQYQDKRRVKWQIRAFPLGGYVTILDSQTAAYTAADHTVALDHRPCWQKCSVYLAGPVMNILIAILLYTSLYIYGIEYIRPLIGEIIPGSIAAEAGMQSEETITYIGDIPIHNWHDTTFELIGYLGTSNQLSITTDAPRTYQLNIEKWTIDPAHLDPLAGIGIQPYRPYSPAIVSHVTPHSPASGAIQAHDRIIAINKRAVDDRESWYEALQGLHNQEVTISLLRHGVPQKVAITTGWQLTQAWKSTAYTGIVIPMTPWTQDQLIRVQYSLPQAWYSGIEQSLRLLRYNGVLLYKILHRIIPLTALSGPIGFVQVAINTLNHPLSVYLELCALFNILLAFVNILPLPGLDGGHIALTLIEGIRGKAIPYAWQCLITRFSIICLVVITIHATINDLLRMVT